MPPRRAVAVASLLVLGVGGSALAQGSGTAQGTLPSTMVTATRFAEPLATLPLGVSVVTAEEIRASGATTVNEAVMRLLGVPGRQDLYGGGDYSLDLRGFGSTAGSNQVVVLDGVRLNEADLGGTRLAGINIDTVERIEVLRGNGAVLYGEGATGGVIVITTKAGVGKERRNGASLYTAVGSYDTQELRASATLAAGGFSVDVAAQDRRSDNHRDNFNSSTDGVDVTAQWSGDALRFGVRHGRDALDTRLPGALSFAQFLQNPRQTTRPNDFASIRNERSGVFAEWLVGNWELGLDAGYREKSLRSFQGSLFGYDIDAETLSLKARHTHQMGTGSNALVLGHDANRWKRLQTSGSTARQNTEAWYARNDFTWASGTRWSVGARTEKLDKEAASGSSVLKDRLTAWDLGVAQPLGTGQQVWARVGSSFRLANVDEFSFVTPGAGLLPQKSRDVEAGWRMELAPYRVELRAYRSRLTNEIGYDPAAVGPSSPFGFDGANVNFDPTTRSGLEADAQWVLGPKLSAGVRAGWRKSVFRSGPYAGQDVPLAPRRTLALRADWVPAPGHRLGGGVNWVSSQAPTFTNQCRIPSYTTVDARYSVQVRSAELSLGVANLFDRNYFTQAFGCAGSNATSLYPEPGRTFTAALRVQF